MPEREWVCGVVIAGRGGLVGVAVATGLSLFLCCALEGHRPRGLGLETQIREAGVIVWAAAEGPVEFAVGFFDGEVVDAGVTVVHDAVFVELPVFVAVGANQLPESSWHS